MQNLLDTYTKNFGKRWERLARWKKAGLIFVIVIFLITIALGFWGLINIKRAQVIVDESLEAKESFEFAQIAVTNQEFDTAVSDLGEANKHFQTAFDNFKRFKVYAFIPGLSKQIKAVDNILQAGINLSAGLQTLAQLGADIDSLLQEKEGDISFADISADEKREILKTLSESPAELHGLKTQIELAVLLIEDIPTDGLLEPVSEAVQPVKEQLPLLEAIVNQLIPAAQSLPAILGYPEDKTYLFLLQNNRELRPTGGFIGTYGILKMTDGEIGFFETDNIYNLDEQAKDTITEPAPAPIAQHTSTQNWLMRDINWSPDFPQTSRKAEEKYHEEGGAESKIDGVIAVTPTFIESLLKMVGPITIDGIEFTEENLFEVLEYHVEFGYFYDGKEDSERKEIIGTLASTLMDELFALDRSRFPEIWETFVDNVDSKQIQMYIKDPITQSLVLEQNWGGEMKSYKNDFIMFVDANMAALKTDNVMERSLSYTVNHTDGDYVATAEMLYQNTGWFDGFHTRYRTYTRIYLPAGAELIEHSGFMTGDKTQGGVATDPEVYEESFTHADGSTVNYTVVAGFTSIEPQQEGTVRIKYKLPRFVAEQIDDGSYDLYVQKQAGTLAHGLQVNFDVGRKISSLSPLDISEQMGENAVSFTTDLANDREFKIRLDK